MLSGLIHLKSYYIWIGNINKYSFPGLQEAAADLHITDN